MLGTSGLLYTAVMMAIRFFDGSYAAGGRFHALLPAGGAPVFGVKGSNPICFLVRPSCLLLGGVGRSGLAGLGWVGWDRVACGGVGRVE